MTEAARRYPNGIHLERRHFCWIAEVIAKELWQLDNATREQVARVFADNLRSTNGQFKRDRFIAACKVEQCE